VGDRSSAIMARMSIRRARPTDFPAIQEVEIEAGRLFAGIGMQAVADDPPFSIGELGAFVASGCAWVAVGVDDRPIGYLVAEVVDGCAHIDQVSVRPNHGRRGVGRALIGHLEAWASARGLPALTLTTFADVPWNAPLYERLGFRRLAASELTPGLRAIRAQEAAAGLDRWPRVAMLRPVGGGAPKSATINP
jgi:ribosomal protein S18 acetylase RimI-like enzyme